ncbi:potassium-transporting ATPase KdpC subunit [Gordonia jinhuaensis]|uniref:Potassium-transporting ATPase KdpC subunit n=2 Tax=Gordonia jinhuaensis TaxID=1517702 RepID=A0A916WQL1_9ACTN|nr:potassium-transporting ATPase KdpC subunit [Gordonia jinhuaensis]
MVLLTVLLGGLYPLAVWAFSRIDSSMAEGSRVSAQGCVIGSSLLGIDPQVKAGEPDPYLHARVAGSGDTPMAPGDPSASGASNLGPANPDLAATITARRKAIATREGVAESAVPADAVTGSASGLDPAISPAYAALQVPRIARVTGRTQDQVRSIIAAHTDSRQWGFLGQPRVNVLEVNKALGAGCNRAP